MTADGSEGKPSSTYVLHPNRPQRERDDATPISPAPEELKLQTRWSPSQPPAGSALDVEWLPIEATRSAFQRWTSIPPPALVRASRRPKRTAPPSAPVEEINLGRFSYVVARHATEKPPAVSGGVRDRVVELLDRMSAYGPGSEIPDLPTLVELGPPALPHLAELFPGRLWFSRWQPHRRPPPGRGVSSLCRALVDFGPAAAPTIAGLLQHETPDKRYYATLVAMDLRDEALAEALGPLIFDADEGVSRAALFALTQLQPHVRVDGVTNMLRAIAINKDARDQQRLLAMRSLAVLRDVASIDPLIDLVSSEIVGEAAWHVLRILCARDFGNDQKQWAEWYQRHRHEPRSEWLLEALVGHDPTLYDLAGRELGRLFGKRGFHDAMTLRERKALQAEYRSAIREKAG